MATSTLKCVSCKERFPADQMVKLPIGNVHSIECAMERIKKNQEAARAKQRRKAANDTKMVEKAARAKHRADKERIKPKSKWLSELQALVNQYVRLRDANDGCISCDKSRDWSGQWHASHYYSRGHSSALRFNLWNLHKSCSVCNNHLSGNIGEYTPKLIDKIGQERFDYLVAHKADVASYDIEWIKRAIRITRKAIKSGR